ncbi:MAG: AbrB/MazE/SpoVT family DNA-binding domain-containing protein [Ruminococcus sp.]|nr:AbrB/MazE/SpoVT family DNA-binding domain-containing protein [Ruminococcus sp.]
MTKHKKLTRAGGVTIPKDMRAATGILPGIAVDLNETEDGILISKHVPTCCFCGSPERVIVFSGTEICSKCVGVMNEEVQKLAE